jgi:hypothetical protein
MKTFQNYKFRPIYFFHKNKKITTNLSILLIIAFLNLTVSCSYYKTKNVRTSPATVAEQIRNFNEQHKYVVIHANDLSWHLEKLIINEDEKYLSGTIQNLSQSHQYSKPRIENRSYKYNSAKNQPLNEVHFYLTNTILPVTGEQITISFSEIQSISVNDKNTGRSILTVFATTVGVIALVFIIVAATKSSCPFVYIKNGEEYFFRGELYPGILTANLQRDDYIPLPNFSASDNEYILKITNELLEIQYTDLAELILINHPKHIEVLLDKNGTPHTFSSLASPKHVEIDNMKNNVKPALKKDNNSYLFNSNIESSLNTRNILLEFDNPTKSDNAKLVITAKNSMWLDYVYGKFNEQYGNYYRTFQRDQQKVSLQKCEQWMIDQNIPLSIYLKTTNGWELVDRINTIGPMATRDIVVPINTQNITDNTLLVKLETGFMFWEVDYAGIDFSENIPLSITHIKPTIAFDENNKNVTNLIDKTDKKYLVQPSIGNEAVVTFRTDAINNNLHQSIFLKNRGFYNYIRQYDGVPNFETLQSFNNIGAFTNFSKNEYLTLMEPYNDFDVVLNDER